jgi:phage FluMu gp28-like protein
MKMVFSKKERLSTAKRLLLAKELFAWQPHPTQKEWLLDNHRVKVAACGRRWGKTESAAVDVATYAIANNGSIQMIVAPTYDQSRLISDAVERLLLSNAHTRKHVKVTRTPYPDIRYRNSRITARTADDDGRNLRGHCADRVVVDEAAFVRDAVIAEVIGPMLADRDGQLVMISTPFGKNHFYRAFIQGQTNSQKSTNVHNDFAEYRMHSRVRSFRFPSWENPHISREYIEFQRTTLTERQFKVEYEAEFVDDSASVFPWEDIQAAVESQLNAQNGQLCKDKCLCVAGIDWARYSDYTAVVVLEIETSGFERRVDSPVASANHRVLALDRFSRIEWQSQVKRVANLLVEYGVTAVAADQTSVGDPVVEMLKSELWECRQADIDVEGVVFTSQTKRQLVDNLAICLAHRRVKIPYIDQLIQELQFYEYEFTESGNIRTHAGHGYHDDCVMALALALKTAARYQFAGGFASSGKSRLSLNWW